MDNYNIFELLYPKAKVTKPIRLIELFAGYGSQALALRYLGASFQHWKIAEWNYKSFNAYNKLHCQDFTDYSKGLTREELAQYLFTKGISADWNKPLTLEQIKRMPEAKQREIYNDIQATNNLVNIQQIKAEDLEMTDRNYCYIMTYSFPCQDLSKAGGRRGMQKGSGTRSGLLWEVERILNEGKEAGTLPDILLMENVPQVHGVGNMEHFRNWMLALEKLGYTNYWEDLIATDYGIPQIRNRTFMLSLKGQQYYQFPAYIPLKWRLKDFLEKNVDGKYYLSEKAMAGIVAFNEKAEEKGSGFKNRSIKIAIRNGTKQGYLEAEEGDGIDISTRPKNRRGTVQKGLAQTLQSIAGGVVIRNGN